MKNYICEIKDIARANKAGSFDDACDMFLANINNTQRPDAQYHYTGAEMINYKALYPRLEQFQKGKKALVDFHQKNIKKVNELYNAGKRDELRKFAQESI